MKINALMTDKRCYNSGVYGTKYYLEMELALTVVTVLGLLLFLIGFLRFVIAGFRHHPIAGIISVIPVLNILLLPSLWHKSGKMLVLGTFGLLLAIGAWYMGAEKGLDKYLGQFTGKQQISTTSLDQKTSLPISATAGNPGNVSDESANTNKVIEYQPRNASIQSDESKMLSLPNQALYRMSFEEVPVKTIPTLLGRIIRVMDNNLELIEGRVTQVNPSSVFVEPTGQDNTNLEIPVANIKKLSLMVKKPR